MQTLLTLITGICVLRGAWTESAEGQRGLVMRLVAQKYSVAYEPNFAPGGWGAPLAEMLGRDYVSGPWGLYCNNSSSDFHGDLATVAQLPSIKKLVLAFTAVDDKDLIFLSGMPNIDFLMLNHSKVTDAGLQHLVNLPLVSLSMDGLALTDGCVEPLKRIQTLRWLVLPEQGISDEAIQELREALPDCQIFRGEP